MASNIQLQKQIQSLNKKVEKLKMEKATLLELAQRAVKDSVDLHRITQEQEAMIANLRSQIPPRFPTTSGSVPPVQPGEFSKIMVAHLDRPVRKPRQRVPFKTVPSGGGKCGAGGAGKCGG